jgi:hypothetical protein
MDARRDTIRGMIAQGRPVNFDAFMTHMKAIDRASEDVGRIARRSGVKTRVLRHLVPDIHIIDDETWRPQREALQARDHRRQGPDGGVRRRQGTCRLGSRATKLTLSTTSPLPP